eukprot:SM000040S14754  [mRNA]  locus=s40:118431:120957:+ [translate_table: standard]
MAPAPPLAHQDPSGHRPFDGQEVGRDHAEAHRHLGELEAARRAREAALRHGGAQHPRHPHGFAGHDYERQPHHEELHDDQHHPQAPIDHGHHEDGHHHHEPPHAEHHGEHHEPEHLDEHQKSEHYDGIDHGDGESGQPGHGEEHGHDWDDPIIDLHTEDLVGDGEEHDWQAGDYDEDPDDYFNYDHFNITWRISTLFPLIDVSPTDGRISEEELTQWHVLQGRKASLHRTDREIETYDRNDDAFISLDEYLGYESDGSGEWDQDLRNKTQEKFVICDLDKDGLLNRDEFNEFLHPEDSENEVLRQWLRKDELKTRDVYEKDGKLSWEEFHQAMYSELRDWSEEQHFQEVAVRGSHVGAQDHQAGPTYLKIEEEKKQKSRAMFDELDKNHDGFLTEDELEPILDKLVPGERHYAQQQAHHMMEQADSNKDGHLSLEEMVEHPYVFYNTAYEEEGEGSHAEPEFEHEELRR